MVNEKLEQVKSTLRESCDIIDSIYRVWIQPLKVIDENDSEVVFGVDKVLQGDICAMLGVKYRTPLEDAIKSVNGKKVDVRFVLSIM